MYIYELYHPATYPIYEHSHHTYMNNVYPATNYVEHIFNQLKAVQIEDQRMISWIKQRTAETNSKYERKSDPITIEEVHTSKHFKIDPMYFYKINISHIVIVMRCV